jgi:hypothetical protein
MKTDLAMRLHRSALTAVRLKHPKLEYWKTDRYVRNELYDRHGQEMAFDILDTMDEIQEETYPEGGLNNRL